MFSFCVWEEKIGIYFNRGEPEAWFCGWCWCFLIASESLMPNVIGEETKCLKLGVSWTSLISPYSNAVLPQKVGSLFRFWGVGHWTTSCCIKSLPVAKLWDWATISTCTELKSTCRPFVNVWVQESNLSGMLNEEDNLEVSCIYKDWSTSVLSSVFFFSSSAIRYSFSRMTLSFCCSTCLRLYGEATDGVAFDAEVTDVFWSWTTSNWSRIWICSTWFSYCNASNLLLSWML